MNYLEAFYDQYDEDARLQTQHGKVEYLTTRKIIRERLEGVSRPRILEIGAGTGRYSVTLAKEGLTVTAVELLAHNLEILFSKLDGTEPITVRQGNALDLSFLPDGSFDLTMLLGPMYHLFTKEEREKALSEAVRVTKPGGSILVSYCMNEPTVVQYVFGADHLQEVLDAGLLTKDWHCKDEPSKVFALFRTEDIAALDAKFPVERIKLVATDGATRYMSEVIDGLDEARFSKWMEYHFSICERQDLVGASHHTLDVLRKKKP